MLFSKYLHFPPKETIKNRFNRGNDTSGSLKEGKKIYRKLGQDRLQKNQSARGENEPGCA